MLSLFLKKALCVSVQDFVFSVVNHLCVSVQDSVFSVVNHLCALCGLSKCQGYFSLVDCTGIVQLGGLYGVVQVRLSRVLRTSGTVSRSPS